MIKVAIFEDNNNMREGLYQLINGSQGFTCTGSFPNCDDLVKRIKSSNHDVVNVAALLTQTGTTGAITGTWTITGGTGRFEGASGTLTIDGIVDFVTFSFTCECVGTITY